MGRTIVVIGNKSLVSNPVDNCKNIFSKTCGKVSLQLVLLWSTSSKEFFAMFFPPGKAKQGPLMIAFLKISCIGASISLVNINNSNYHNPIKTDVRNLGRFNQPWHIYAVRSVCVGRFDHPLALSSGITWADLCSCGTRPLVKDMLIDNYGQWFGYDINRVLQQMRRQLIEASSFACLEFLKLGACKLQSFMA